MIYLFLIPLVYCCYSVYYFFYTNNYPIKRGRPTLLQEIQAFPCIIGLLLFVKLYMFTYNTYRFLRKKALGYYYGTGKYVK